jgi:hypothetical protein
MSVKSLLAKPFALLVHNKIKKGAQTAVADQESIFKTLLKKAVSTQFGIDHSFDKIKSYDNFKRLVPIRDYEQLKD